MSPDPAVCSEARVDTHICPPLYKVGMWYEWQGACEYLVSFPNLFTPNRKGSCFTAQTGLEPVFLFFIFNNLLFCTNGYFACMHACMSVDLSQSPCLCLLSAVTTDWPHQNQLVSFIRITWWLPWLLMIKTVHFPLTLPGGFVHMSRLWLRSVN